MNGFLRTAQDCSDDDGREQKLCEIFKIRDEYARYGFFDLEKLTSHNLTSNRAIKNFSSQTEPKPQSRYQTFHPTKMPFATPVVPMPHWSTPLGCTKLFLTIVVLAFTAACIAIWGWYPAFGTTIFSVSHPPTLAPYGFTSNSVRLRAILNDPL